MYKLAHVGSALFLRNPDALCQAGGAGYSA